MHALALCCVNQCMTFEVLSFTNSKDVIGAKFKKTGHMTLTVPIREYFVIPRLTLYFTCVQNLATLALAIPEI